MEMYAHLQHRVIAILHKARFGKELRSWVDDRD